MVDGVEINEAVLVQAERGLGAQDLADGFVDAALAESLRFFTAAKNSVVGAVEVAGNEDVVGSGLDGLDGGTARALRRVAAEDAGNAVHIHCVGDDDALEAELILQQTGADVVGKSGDTVGIGLKRRHEEMADHHCIDACGDGSTEGRQLNLIEALAGGIDAGERKMRIRVGISVAGKMLCGGHAVSIVHSLDEGLDHLADFGGSSPKERVLMMGLLGLEFTSASG